MKHPRHILQILALAAALAAAGQNAWATTKTVTYTITNSIQIGNGNNNYRVTMTRSGDVPFDGSGPDYSVEMSPESLYAINGTYGDYTFSLADGFKLQLQWGAGSNVQIRYNENKNAYYLYPTAEGTNKKITYTVSCPDNYYYTTHVMMTGTESGFQSGMPQTYPNSGSIDTDYNSVWNFSETYYSAYSFGQITITYSDVPSLSIFESDGGNAYKIKDKHDLRHLANYVNNGKSDCSGLTFLQTEPITCDDTYVPIGYFISADNQAVFSGTYNGQGKTVSGITVTRTGNTNADGYIGLFGQIGGGTVKNVVLASSTFTGYWYVGGIVGFNKNCTIENCRVESSVTIKAGADQSHEHGGIVGFNTSGTIIGCISAATLSLNEKNMCSEYGGITGYTYNRTIRNCLYIGTTVEATHYKGAIVGRNGDFTTLTNNYYTTTGLQGVNGSDQNGARRARTVTLGENVALVGEETAYDVSGLTAIGTGNYALRYNDGTTTKIYSGEGQVLTLTYTGSVPTGCSVVYTVTKTSDQSDVTASVLSGSTLTVPAIDVTISASVTATPVDVTYIDADGKSQTVTATPLLGTETELGVINQETWFVVNSDISYDHEVALIGDVHLILADGKTMTMTISDSDINKVCLKSEDLTIYGQNGGTGALTATCENSSALGCTRNLTINGGRITATAKYNALGSMSITINGGVVNAISSDQDGFYSTGSTDGNITINGGQVETNRMSSSGSIIFGYRNSTDYITIGSRGCSARHNTYIAAGKSMTDGTNIYTASANSNTRINATLKDVTLHPVIPASVELTLTRGTKDGVTAYWGTFYDNAAGYGLPAGATAYTMDDNKNLYRLGTDGSKIPAGVPVVIISELSAITLTKEDGAISAADHAPGGNILRGTNGLIVPEFDYSDQEYKVDGKIPYVLSVSEGVIGFRKKTGKNDSQAIPAHKAYYLQ